MSVDWFIVLSPIAALPIVLSLGFTGCVLDRHGTALPQPWFSYPPGLNLTLTGMKVTMTVVGVNDSRTETKSLKALDILAARDTIVFSIDVSTINTSPPFGEGLIGPALTITCDCTVTIEGNPPVSLPLSADHDGDDVDSLNINFTLAGSGLDPNNYSLA